MNFKFLLFLSFSTFFTAALKAQNIPQARISGYVIDKNTQKPLTGVTIEILGTGKGANTDSSGFFRITTSPGTYNFKVTRITYGAKTINNVVLTSGNETTLSIELEPDSKNLDEVVIINRRNSARATSLESPLSVQRMTTEEIKRNPGGNFDISKVIQSLPGVGGGVVSGMTSSSVAAPPVRMYITLMALKSPSSTILVHRAVVVGHRAS
jgi:hypothetical protein